MLIGGHDGYDGGAALYFMDYLATMAKVNDAHLLLISSENLYTVDLSNCDSAS